MDQRPSRMLAVPHHILALVLGFLEAPELLGVADVCTRFNANVRSNGPAWPHFGLVHALRSALEGRLDRSGRTFSECESPKRIVCITWFQTQLILTTCQGRYQSHLAQHGTALILDSERFLECLLVSGLHRLAVAGTRKKEIVCILCIPMFFSMSASESHTPFP